MRHTPLVKNGLLLVSFSIVVIGFLFILNHWSYGHVILGVGCVVYLFSRIIVMRGPQKLQNSLVLVSFAIILSGLLFILNRSAYGYIILAGGWVTYFLLKIGDMRGAPRLQNLLLSIGFAMTLVGILFALEHWPYGGVLLGMGCVIYLISAILGIKKSGD